MTARRKKRVSEEWIEKMPKEKKKRFI